MFLKRITLIILCILNFSHVSAKDPVKQPTNPNQLEVLLSQISERLDVYTQATETFEALDALWAQLATAGYNYTRAM